MLPVDTPETPINSNLNLTFTPIAASRPFSGIPPVKKLSYRLTLKDKLGDLAVRWSVGRNSWRVEPGLYALGNPDRSAPVLVTANYRLTVNIVRRSLIHHNLWLLVLDTKGINVWCAAGKGTFGTDEIIHRIKNTGLTSFIDHRELILPQLGAPGVAGYKITRATGFKIIWGPVTAADIPAFLAAGKKASPEMRRVRFGVRERLTVAPVEIVQAWPFFLTTLIIAFLASFGAVWKTAGGSLSPAGIIQQTLASAELMRSVLLLTGNVITGTILFPLFLPLLPFKAFAAKGAVLSLLWSSAILLIEQASGGVLLTGPSYRTSVTGAALCGAAAASFLAMNLTGSSTFTNQTGTMLEVKISIPLQLLAATAGLVLLGISIAFSGSLLMQGGLT